jgi:hypothetical protein
MEHRTVEMLKTSRGSPNGVIVNTYDAGVVYDLPIDLAVVFVEKMRVAKYYAAPVKVGPSETRVEVVVDTEPEHETKYKHAPKHKRKG